MPDMRQMQLHYYVYYEYNLNIKRLCKLTETDFMADCR